MEMPDHNILYFPFGSIALSGVIHHYKAVIILVIIIEDGSPVKTFGITILRASEAGIISSISKILSHF